MGGAIKGGGDISGQIPGHKVGDQGGTKRGEGT